MLTEKCSQLIIETIRSNFVSTNVCKIVNKTYVEKDAINMKNYFNEQMKWNLIRNRLYWNCMSYKYKGIHC